jgi:Lipopolysaccharide biosynthesis proteins, LPS:glycosyltransferases
MVDIVLCTDDNYVMPTAVLMTSIGHANKALDIHYHIVTAGLSQASQDKLARNKGSERSSISYYTIDESFLKNCPVRPGEHVSIATYFRLMLPTILPQSITKVLYIDGDIICIDSLEELWNTPLDGIAAAAAPDMRCNDIRNLNRLSLDRNDEYLNAGVMLINLDWWRQNDVQNKAIRFISENQDVCLFHDQDALNVVLHGYMQQFPIRYNLQEHFLEPFENQFISQAHYEDLQSALENPCLIHYTGFRKPWHRECVNPLKSAWLYVYSKTEWKGRKLGFRHKGFRLFKYRLREFLSNFHLAKSKNIYKGLDFSCLEQKVLDKVKVLF